MIRWKFMVYSLLSLLVFSLSLIPLLFFSFFSQLLHLLLSQILTLLFRGHFVFYIFFLLILGQQQIIHCMAKYHILYLCIYVIIQVYMFMSLFKLINLFIFTLQIYLPKYLCHSSNLSIYLTIYVTVQICLTTYVTFQI